MSLPTRRGARARGHTLACALLIACTGWERPTRDDDATPTQPAAIAQAPIAAFERYAEQVTARLELDARAIARTRPATREEALADLSRLNPAHPERRAINAALAEALGLDDATLTRVLAAHPQRCAALDRRVEARLAELDRTLASWREHVAMIPGDPDPLPLWSPAARPVWAPRWQPELARPLSPRP
ncbi:MAG: hypothetical protein KC636_08600 [Myxococcales bacterium]|nr:hypothetical protein [Myxococcales bacterium]